MERGALTEGRLQAAAQAAPLSGVEQLQWEPLQGEAPQEETLQEEPQHIQ